jgi:flagella synthesis protein FlgN
VSAEPADVRQHLNRILTDEGRLIAELERLLQQEVEILQGEDADQIARIGAVRHRCVEALMRLEDERADLTRMLSFGDGRGAIERLLAWCDEDGSLKTRWQANLDIARRCKDINDRNGAIVGARLRRVQAVLAAMRGSAPMVYGAGGGAAHQPLPGRQLGQA